MQAYKQSFSLKALGDKLYLPSPPPVFDCLQYIKPVTNCNLVPRPSSFVVSKNGRKLQVIENWRRRRSGEEGNVVLRS